MKDNDLIDLYWRRDPDAVTQTEARYGARCRGIALRILGTAEDADECVGDVWLRVWNAIPPQRPEHFWPFLAKITRNAALDRLAGRKAARRGGGQLELALHELDECIPSPSSVEDEVMAAELGRCIDRFVRTLNERDAGVFLRRYFFIEPAADIARRYRLSKNHVEVILSRTRRKIRKHLEQEGWLP